jgi:probable addiction module antidote protein
MPQKTGIDFDNLRNNPMAVCKLLNKALKTQDPELILSALYQSLTAQNVSAVARESGLRREKLYRSMGGNVDPKFSRVIKLLTALNVRLVSRPAAPKASFEQPKLGRPIKKPSAVPPPRRKLQKPDGSGK